MLLNALNQYCFQFSRFRLEFQQRYFLSLVLYRILFLAVLLFSSCSIQGATLSESKYILDQRLKQIDTTEIPFLLRQIEYAYQYQPYKGVRILHSLPLDLIGAIKISALHLGGAEVVVFHPKFADIKSLREGVELLEVMGIEYRENQTLFLNEAFDIYMDCFAELIDLPPPRLGYIELTRSGEIIYENRQLLAPVISVNNSHLKMIETFYGTADGCIRGLKKFVGEELMNKRYLIFGYGNVGAGIANRLAQMGYEVMIIDRCELVLQKAEEKGFKTALYSDQDKCQELVERAEVVITATGVENAVTPGFGSASFFEHKILINMGTSDEYGPFIKEDSVINNKKPMNFALDRPTRWIYLDPVFYAHNYAVEILMKENFERKVYCLPKGVDEEIYQEWASQKFFLSFGNTRNCYLIFP